jgi:hypothetical protein
LALARKTFGSQGLSVLGIDVIMDSVALEDPGPFDVEFTKGYLDF